jgi:tripartite-type tricarboxylate transporter receptor subunit TctC
MIRSFAAILLSLCATGALAQYPAKPVRLIISFAAGGPTDVVGRMLADRLSNAWGQPVVVENRPGAGGTIGSALIAKAAPDGHTLNLAASSHAYNDALIPNLPYDPIKDFTPIAQVISYSNILVTHPSAPGTNLRELIAYAKANPGKLAFASAGSGTGAHLAVELFKRAAGIDVLVVHFKGAAPATTDLLAGQVHAMFNNPLSAMPHIKAGKVRALAVTSLRRAPSVPDVPTVAESGYPGFNSDTWFGMIGPAGLPRDIVGKVAKDTAAFLANPEVRQKLAAMGLEAAPSTPERLAELIRTDHGLYGKLIREAKIKVE